MPPSRTEVDRAELRTASSPLSPSSRPNLNEGVENESEPGENLDSESRWKRLYLQEQRKRLNEQNEKKQRNE
jgi:hypothetical protein